MDMPPSRPQTLTPAWFEARERIRSVAVGERAPFVRLAELIDLAGLHTAKLQALLQAEHQETERGPELSRVDKPWIVVLNFIDADVIDVLRGASSRAARLIPGPHWEEEADPSESRAEVELFARYLEMLRLTTWSSDVPPNARDVIRQVASALDGWVEQVTDAIDAIEILLVAREADPTLAEEVSE
jgi:hypothetical protein